MKKISFVIKFDIAKEARRSSREIFKGVNMVSKRHKDKRKYTRKDKHKKAMTS